METLIILFIIYSLFQWLFGDNKKKQQQKQRQQQQQRNQRASGREESQEAPQSWEDAMAELESIFSGEPPRRRKPEPKPVPAPVQQTETYNRPQPKREEFSADPFSDDMSTQRRSQHSRVDIQQLKSDGNPIYSGAIGESDEDYEKVGGIDSGDARDVLQYINDPEAARKAIIMKEIFDRPKSQRRSARVF